MVDLIEDFPPNVKSAIDAIIASEKIFSPPSIDVAPGSQIGDGFTSKTYAITIKGNEKTINLFVKCFPEKSMSALIAMFSTVFHTELRFYEEIFPEMLKFQQSKELEEGEIFDNVPRHYRTGINYEGIPPIVLENLRCSGYTLRELKVPIDDAHVMLALKSLAKYHAISYAMKDQKPDLFKQFSSNIKDTYLAIFNVMGVADIIGKMMDGFVASLDPISDKNLLNACRNLGEVLVEHTISTCKQQDDYSVICQGDCWSNNMMFQYEEKSGSPINVKLIDWQVQRYNSPALDISYYFYSVATKETLANFDKYFKFYYDSLADQVRKLGSDPRKMYPPVVFLNHWKKFAKFGLTMSFGAMMGLCMEKEELPNITENENIDMSNLYFSDNAKRLFFSKIKLIVEHFVERDFL